MLECLAGVAASMLASVVVLLPQEKVSTCLLRGMVQSQMKI
jgi:hypothetical protein